MVMCVCARLLLQFGASANARWMCRCAMASEETISLKRFFGNHRTHCKFALFSAEISSLNRDFCRSSWRFKTDAANKLYYYHKSRKRLANTAIGMIGSLRTRLLWHIKICFRPLLLIPHLLCTLKSFILLVYKWKTWFPRAANDNKE